MKGINKKNKIKYEERLCEKIQKYALNYMMDNE